MLRTNKNTAKFSQFECSRKYDNIKDRNSYMILQIFFYYYYFVCEAIGTAATPGLLCQPQVIMKMIMEKQMECRLAGKPKFSEKTCPSAT
jgi:hypothetical protein